MKRALLLATWLIPLTACALFDDAVDHTVGSCDLRGSEVTREAFCQEWRGLIAAPAYPTQEGLCATLGSSYEELECPSTATIVGGCFLGKLGDGSGSYQWYYSDGPEPKSRDEVIETCGEDGPFVEFFPFDVDADDYGPPEE